jgi:hypothetical protein
MPDGTFEVCASGEAHHDEQAARLEVRLAACLRSMDLRAKERQFSAAWLPSPETVREGVGREEAAAVARDIFHRWTRRVKSAVPESAHLGAVR